MFRLYLDIAVSSPINDRVEFLQSVYELIRNWDEKQKNKTGIPSKIIFWFDINTIQPIPTDELQYTTYLNIKRKLLFVERDATFFGIATNTSALSDIITDKKRLVKFDNIDALNQIRSLSEKISEIPATFQYSDCNVRPSKNIVYQGLITPYYKQYWAMYPETYLKSYKIEFKVSYIRFCL